MKNFIKEFKAFIARGNVLDMAIGVVIGSAFGKIVSSLVDNIIMPIVGVIIGGHDFSNLTINIGDATIFYGIFIQNVVDFLIIALCIFTVIKMINKLSHKKKEEEKEVEVNEEVILLQEIRDLLKSNKKKTK